jgi:hypothetical protein
MIASGDTIVWARLFGPAFEYAANSLTRRVLIVTEARDLHANGNPAEDLQRLNE